MNKFWVLILAGLMTLSLSMALTGCNSGDDAGNNATTDVNAVGDNTGLGAGDNIGDNAGLNAGDNMGYNAGDNMGDNAGMNAGDNMGGDAGSPPGPAGTTTTGG